ncbi:uncharacterized protein C8A04DRAFT_24614 [Dichotomopilus funicola]|uniref:Uncharacterized protein n=1 Tax=Dichotomopilus funicola TaxID=1934379 RepID=A0AAN6V9T1_9PEZI|nr:hypothetical protein C8A04DRAFT_24614 [Dichotomopilus funicola]
MKSPIQLGFVWCAIGLVAAVQPPPSQSDVAFTSALVRRTLDLSTYFKSYDTAVKNLTTYVDVFASDPRRSYDFGYAAGFLISFMSGGAKVIGDSGASVTDEVPGVIETVRRDVSTLATTLISQKPAFERAGACTYLHNATSDLATHHAELTTALLAKLPTDYQEFAQGFATSIGGEYLKASAAFADGNCTDGSSSGSGSSATSIGNPGEPSATGGSGSGTNPTYDPSQTGGVGSPDQTGSSGQSSPTGDAGNQINPGRTSSDALSDGTKVGIGVGVSVGVLSLIGGALALWFCLRRRQQPQQTPVYSNTAIMPPYPEAEDTGKRELGGVEIQSPPGKSPAPSPAVAVAAAEQPYPQPYPLPSTELDGRQQTPAPVGMDNRQHTPGPVELSNRVHTPGPVEMGPAVPPTSELSAHPYHVYDPGYNQQPQLQQQPQQWHQGQHPHA